jgi:acyl-CoA dehydrogenase
MREDNEITAIRESVRALCAKFPGEYWRELDRERAYPTEFVEALTSAGFLAALIPEEYGGSGLSMRAAAAIMEEIQAAGCNGAACHAQMYTMGTVLRHGSDEQKKKYLPAIARGELRLQAFGVTEPTSGTDTLSLRTTAVRDGDEYVINGQKIWTSRAQYSDLMLLLARTTPRDKVQKRTDGLSVLLIDMRTVKGLTIRPIRTMMNHATTEVFFDNMRVPASSLIGEEGKGFRYILSGMNAERILIAAECIGDAKWFIAKASAYAKDRSVFGRPIGQNQGIQFPIARAYAQMSAKRPISPSSSPPMPRGRRPTCACRPMAGSALPRNTTSSASSAKRGSIRWRRSRPISSCLISPSTCSACPAPISRVVMSRCDGRACPGHPCL